MRRFALVFCGLFVGSCSGATSAEQVRQAWLVEALTDDNRVWLARELGPLSIKYDRMEDDVYDYLRATAGVFLRDVGRTTSDRIETTFVTEPGAAAVLLVGDPHLENMGTLRPGPVLLELNDFDGSVFGPYVLDVRRMAVGLAYLADEGGCGCADAVVDASVVGYLAALEAGGPSIGLVQGNEPQLLQDLLDGVTEKGSTRRVLEEATERTATGRRFRITEALDASGRGLLGLSSEEHLQLDRLLAAGRLPSGFRELHRARRFGSGIASLPAIRYVVAYDTGDDSDDDDAMLSIREVVDPPAVPGVRSGAPGYWLDGADRIEATARSLWSRPDADPPYAGIQDGPMTFKVQQWTGWHASLDHVAIVTRLQDGRVGAPDLVELAGRLGGVLGHAHQGAPTANGGSAQAVILADVAGRSKAFRAERVADAQRDLRQLRLDHRLFVSARASLGPWLGADQLEGL